MLKASLKQCVLVVGTSVLASAIGMVNQRRFWPAGDNRHPQRLERQLSGNPCPERPTDASPTKCVDHNGQVYPRRPESHEGDVGDPELIGSRWVKPRKICKLAGRMPAAPFRPSQRFGLQVVRTHKPQRAFCVNSDAFSAKTIGHLAIPVSRMLDQNVLDSGHDPQIASARRRLRRAVEGRSRDIERARKNRDGQAHHTVWRRNHRAGEFLGQREAGYAPLSRAKSLMRCKAFLAPGSRRPFGPAAVPVRRPWHYRCTLCRDRRTHLSDTL